MGNEIEAKSKKLTGYMRLDPFFRTNVATVMSKDGSKRRFTIQHQMGRERAYTLRQLMDLTKLEEEAVEEALAAKRGIHNKKTAQRVYNTILREALNKVRGWVKSYKADLIEFYLPQRIRPVMNFVPNTDAKAESDKPVVFIQGFYDLDSLMPVLGDIDSVTLALEIRNANLVDKVNEYRENQAIAKKSLSLPGINRDIQNRLNNIVAGNVTKHLLEERLKSNEEGDDTK
jgi:hypothetical protein